MIYGSLNKQRIFSVNCVVMDTSTIAFQFTHVKNIIIDAT